MSATREQASARGQGQLTVFFFARSPEAPRTTMMVFSLSSMVLSVAQLAAAPARHAFRRSARLLPMRWDRSCTKAAGRAALGLAGRRTRGSNSPSIGLNVGVNQRVGHCACKMWFRKNKWRGKGGDRGSRAAGDRRKKSDSCVVVVSGEMGGRGWKLLNGVWLDCLVGSF